jgi:hypothetical protein
MPDPVSIVQQLLHPPLGLCTLEPIAGGPFAGGTYAFNRPRGPVNTDAFGLVWSTTLVAIGVGGTPGLVFEYEDRVIELAAHYVLLDGTPVIGQRVASNLDNGMMLFQEALPQGVDVIVGPPFAVDLWWVLLL